MTGWCFEEGEPCKVKDSGIEGIVEVRYPSHDGRNYVVLADKVRHIYREDQLDKIEAEVVE